MTKIPGLGGQRKAHSEGGNVRGGSVGRGGRAALGALTSAAALSSPAKLVTMKGTDLGHQKQKDD